jgi:hypothetical protein
MYFDLFNKMSTSSYMFLQNSAVFRMLNKFRAIKRFSLYYYVRLKWQKSYIFSGFRRKIREGRCRPVNSHPLVARSGTIEWDIRMVHRILLFCCKLYRILYPVCCPVTWEQFCSPSHCLHTSIDILNARYIFLWLTIRNRSQGGYWHKPCDSSVDCGLDGRSTVPIWGWGSGSCLLEVKK